MTETPILDEGAVSEIEARYERAEAKYLAITQGKEWWRETETPTSVIGESLADVPALCQTVRALRAALRDHGEHESHCKSNERYPSPRCDCVLAQYLDHKGE